MANLREYIQVSLIDSLTNGVIYRASFYVSPADALKFSADNVGACFSKTAITCSSGGSCIINCIPQIENSTGNIITDTANWTLVTGTFTATGGEKYMTIGNFNTDANTHYALINSTSTYGGVYFYIDDVSLYPDSVTTSNEFKVQSAKFQIYPNPNEGKFNLKMSGFENLKMQRVFIYNFLGEVVYAKEGVLKTETEIDISNLPQGMYFIKVMDEYKNVHSEKIIIRK